MQCNSINVMEEPVIITRNSHPAELDLPRAPQPPNGEGTPFVASQYTRTYTCTHMHTYTYMCTHVSTGPGSTSLGGLSRAGRWVDGWVSQPSRTGDHHQNHSWGWASPGRANQVTPAGAGESWNFYQLMVREQTGRHWVSMETTVWSLFAFLPPPAGSYPCTFPDGWCRHPYP